MAKVQAIVEATREWPESAWTLPAGTLPDDGGKGEIRFEIVTAGPYRTVSRVAGLAVTDTGLDTEHYGHYPNRRRIIGPRVLEGARESGYDMEGYVHVDGQRRSAFTSSMLVFGPAGRLIDVAVLYVRGERIP